MTPRTIWRMLRSGRLRLLLRLGRLAPAYYRLVWLSAAARAGVLARLAASPAGSAELASALGHAPEMGDAFEAWLGVGARLGEIERGPQGWRLRGFLARRLAVAANDDVAAMCEEVAGLHHALLAQTPGRLVRGEPFSLADQDGTVIARSSRVLEPALFDAIDRHFPVSGPVSLLEIGCGSGVYIRHAALRNPQLVALGLELQPDVAELAARNLRDWGLASRARVEKGDVRERAPELAFDLATLHNNIYYFPVAERQALLEHVGRFLRPGGRIVVTTGCAGGSPAMRVLDLWGAATRGCGRLPDPEELEGQLRSAGFASVASQRIVPGESYFAFVGVAL